MKILFFFIEKNDVTADRNLTSKNDVASFDIHTEEEKTNKIQQHEIQIDYVDSNNDFLCVDQMTTPRHALFENEYEYQNVLMDIYSR